MNTSLIVKRLTGTAITTAVAILLFSGSARSLQPSASDEFNHLASLTLYELGLIRCTPSDHS